LTLVQKTFALLSRKPSGMVFDRKPQGHVAGAAVAAARLNIEAEMLAHLQHDDILLQHLPGDPFQPAG
jgi:hypothetical protein